MESEDRSLHPNPLNRRKFLGSGAALAATAALGLALPRRVEAQSAPQPDEGVLNVRKIQASLASQGRGYSDVDAIREAVHLAKASRSPQTIYFPGGNYLIDGLIEIDFTSSADWEYQEPGMGRIRGCIIQRGIRFVGENSKLVLDTSGGLAFHLKLPPTFGKNGADFARPANIQGAHESRFAFENLAFFYPGQTSGQRAILAHDTDFLTIRDCSFYRLGDAVRVERCTGLRVEGCIFEACAKAFESVNCRDAILTRCYFNASGRAITAMGVTANGSVDTGADGGFQVTETTVIGSAEWGIKFEGLYSPVITNVQSEGNHINFHLNSCLNGWMSDIWSGPLNDSYGGATTSIALWFSNTLGPKNSGWRVSNVVALCQVIFDAVQDARIDGLVVARFGSAIHGAAITIIDSYRIQMNVTVRELETAIQTSVRVEANSSGIIFDGGYYDRTILLARNAGQARHGCHLFRSPYMFQCGVDFAGNPKIDEAGDFFVLQGGDQAVAHKGIKNGEIIDI